MIDIMPLTLKVKSIIRRHRSLPTPSQFELQEKPKLRALLLIPTALLLVSSSSLFAQGSPGGPQCWEIEIGAKDGCKGPGCIDGGGGGSPTDPPEFWDFISPPRPPPGSGGYTPPPEMIVTAPDLEPNALTGDPYLDAVHLWKWVPTAASLMDLFVWGGETTVGSNFAPFSNAPSTLQAAMEAFDGDSYELHGMTPPGEATLHDFYGVNLATGQLEVSLPTGIRLTGINGDDLELKVNIRSGVQREGRLGQFASLNMEDCLVINKLISLTESTPGACSTGQSEMWKVRDLVNSSPTLTRMRGGNPEVWHNIGPPSSDPSLNLVMSNAAFFTGMPTMKWTILNQNSSLCRWRHIDSSPPVSAAEYAWRTGAGTPPPPTDVPLNFGAADPYLTDLIQNPPDVYYVFLASWGRQEILSWDCGHVAIMDADGTNTVYSGFYKQKDTRACVSDAQLPHSGQQGTHPGPNIGPTPQSMAQVQLVARCLYKETRDGLRTYYLYNRYGDLVGFRDPAGREIGFNPGRIEEIRDEFGRSCNLAYDGVGNLSAIALPDAYSGDSSQLQLTRVIEVRITEEGLPARDGHLSVNQAGQLAERVRLKKLEIGTPLDAVENPGVYSFEVDFVRYGHLIDPANPYTGNRVQSVRLSSNRMPSWLSTETAGGTTYYDFLDLMNYNTCGQDYRVQETRPDNKVVVHTFDAHGNLVQMEEPAQLTDGGAEITLTTRIDSDSASGADALNLKTSITYPGTTPDPVIIQEAWEYQFQSDEGKLASYFRYAVSADTPQQFFAKHNVLKEHKKGTQGGDLVTTYGYGEYRRLKSKIPPMNFGSGTSGMEFEHTFDYEATNPEPPFRHVVIQTRYPNVSTAPYATADVVHTFKYNNYGQLQEKSVFNNNGVEEKTVFTRHLINDPDGDGFLNWEVDPYTAQLPGYLKDETIDAAGLNIQTSHAYDSWGNEIQTTNPELDMVYRQFNEMNQVYAIHEGTFTISGNPAVIDPPSGDTDGYARTEHIFDEAGNVTEVRKYNNNADTRLLGANASAVTTKYEYDGLDRLVHMTLELANPFGAPQLQQLETYWLRDELGRITLETRPNLSATSVIYSPQGTVLEYREHYNASTSPKTVPVPNANFDRVMELTYDENKRVVEGKDALGESELLYYDEFGRLVARRNAHGTLTHQVLNGMGLPTSESVYGPVAAMPNPTSDPMKRTDYLYDERFRVKQQDVQWFEQVGGVNTSIGDGSITTTYQYDAKDQLRFETNDKLAVTEYRYDAAGRKEKLIYPQTAELPPGTQNEDQWTYDKNDNVKTLTLVEYGIADGASTATQHLYSIAYEYDELNRERIIDRIETGTAPADSERWYDSLGNILKERQPRMGQQIGTMFTVDTAGQVVKIQEGYTSGFTGVAAGLITATNADGYVTLLKVYDEAGNVKSEEDDNGNITRYTYDLLNRRERVTYGDATYETVVYRQDDLVTRLTAYDATSTQLFNLAFTYEDKRRKTESYSVNFGPFTGLYWKEFTYDDLDRPTLSEARSRDPHSSAREWWADTLRTYDSLDRVLTGTQTLSKYTSGTGVKTQQFTVDVTSDYDALGNIKTTTSSVGSGGPFEIARTFDTLNRLLSVADTSNTENTVFGEYEWRGARGRVETIRHPVTSAKTRIFNYDQRGRPKMRLTEKADGTELAGRQYEYGASSVRLFESKLPGPSTDDHVFTHDPLDRLIKFEEGDFDEAGAFVGGLPVRSEEFGYDGAGSIRLFTTTVGQGAPNSIINATDTTNAYASGFIDKVATRDERGNMSEIGNQNLVYDVFGHLVGTLGPFPWPVVPTLEIRDAFDRRVFRKYGSVKTSFVFEGIRVIQEVVLDLGPGPDVVEREYIHGAGLDELVGQRIGGQAYAMHVDSLGTPYAVTNIAGALEETHDTDPFGNRTTDPEGNGETGNRIGFVGMWYDSITDLYFVRARHYSPFLRRFTSRDPLGVWGDMVNRGNIYAYVWNSPTKWVDPMGLDVWVEGRAPNGEPYGHQSLSVGNPQGSYVSFSFGATLSDPFSFSNGLQGTLYQDVNPGGEIDANRYYKTSGDVDAIIVNKMKGLVKDNENERYVYRLGNANCRNWCQDQFGYIANELDEHGKGESAEPPVQRAGSNGNGEGAHPAGSGLDGGAGRIGDAVDDNPILSSASASTSTSTRGSTAVAAGANPAGVVSTSTSATASVSTTSTDVSSNDEKAKKKDDK